MFNREIYSLLINMTEESRLRKTDETRNISYVKKLFLRWNKTKIKKYKKVFMVLNCTE